MNWAAVMYGDAVVAQFLDFDDIAVYMKHTVYERGSISIMPIIDGKVIGL